MTSNVSLVPEPVELVSFPSAPLGASDTTRRFSLRFDDGARRFPGLTRGEAAVMITRLGGPAGALRDDLLVAIGLPVLVSDGAGPYLLAADGSLVLVLGPHAHLRDHCVAMGQPNPDHLIGAVVDERDVGWHWTACATVSSDQHIDALDGLAAAADEVSLSAWGKRWNQ